MSMIFPRAGTKKELRVIAFVVVVTVWLLMQLAETLVFKTQSHTPTSPSNSSSALPSASSGQVVLGASQSAELAQVTRVIDGDTVEVSLNGVTEKIRLIGINTPETVDPRRGVECFGKEASARASALLLHQSVRLEDDATQQNRDRYQRLLRYLFLSDGSNANLTMIREGYAYEYTYDLPYRYQAEFKQAQREAQEAQRGLWAPNVCASP